MYLIEMNSLRGMRSFSVFFRMCEISVCVWESDSQHQHSQTQKRLGGYTFGGPGTKCFMWLSHHDNIKPHSVFLLLQRKRAYSIYPFLINILILVRSCKLILMCQTYWLCAFQGQNEHNGNLLKKKKEKEMFLEFHKEILYRQSIKMSNYYNTDVLCVKCKKRLRKIV